MTASGFPEQQPAVTRTSMQYRRDVTGWLKTTPGDFVTDAFHGCKTPGSLQYTSP